MEIQEIEIEGVYIIKPTVFQDQRGYFQETFNQKKWEEHITPTSFLQDNESKSSYGVVRGLHYQLPPFAQAKLVRVVTGAVKDVIVDIRPESNSFGEKFEIELTEENKTQLFIPKGFAHGFSVLTETAIFAYKCDDVYSHEFERGIFLLDKYLNIDWGIPRDKMIISDKDNTLPIWGDHHPFI